jgi:hypothetical protein
MSIFHFYISVCPYSCGVPFSFGLTVCVLCIYFILHKVAKEAKGEEILIMQLTSMSFHHSGQNFFCCGMGSKSSLVPHIIFTPSCFMDTQQSFNEINLDFKTFS